MARAIGIDLGTTNSCMAVLEGGEPKIIANAEGMRTTPSIVAFTKTGEALVGEVAKRQAVTNPTRTVRSVKRRMGTGWTLDIDGHSYTPQEISARILQKLTTDAEAHLGESVTEAVITVPAYFNDPQRTATKEAGEIAGFTVLRILNEPTAAALAYSLEKRPAQERALVFDLGGGTFDVSLLALRDGQVEVLTTSGDNNLGGDDWDQRIIDSVLGTIRQRHGVDASTDPVALQRLKEAAEKAKIELSAMPSTSINLPYLTSGPDGPLHVDVDLARSELQRMTQDLLDRCTGPFNQAISDAAVPVDDIAHVLLVGGSTRMPAVAELVKSLTGKEPSKTVNPDEVVAVGAALQAGLLKGELRSLTLLDITSLSLGVGIKGGIFAPLIKRNTKIPAKKSKDFTTITDRQTSVSVEVYQGERPMVEDNMSLGNFELTGLPKAPKGTPQIQVTFEIDANGIVEVTAKDLATGNAQSMIVTGESALSKRELEQMRRDARRHVEADRQRRQAAEIRNIAEAVQWDVTQLLIKDGDRMPGIVRDELNYALTGIGEALAGTDIAKLWKTTQWLDYLHRTVTADRQDAAGSQEVSRVGDRMRATAPWQPGTGLVTTGDVLGGRYRLARPLGLGGYGGVWEAQDQRTGSMVAVKVLHAELMVESGQRQEVLARFQREADTLMGLRHPHVVQVHDRGVHQDIPFLVMELVSGRSLAAELGERMQRRGKAFPLKELVAIGVQICSGLTAIHRLGLVHRDLKPLNLMFTSAKTVKIVDFGLVRPHDATAITIGPLPVGTPPYMAPEQFYGDHPPDARTDLYSLGCSLYELACGESAFDRRGIGWAVVHKRIAPTPLRQRLRGASRDLEALLANLLEKDPRKRPQTADEVLERLQRL
jgi:molecular chaperone DnaK